MGLTVKSTAFTVESGSIVTVTGNAGNSSYGYAAVRLYNDYPFTVDSTSELYIEDNNNTALYVRQGNLTVEDGEYVLLCGKSGCGKTTLLRHCKTVLTPHGKREGEILFHGKPLEKSDQRTQAARIGYVMQDPDAQIVTDKVWHELAFGLESLGMDQKTMRLRVAEMASYFGIQDWFYKDVGQLSGGQKQLLNLASIMAMQPDVLIMDEPTSQLDPIAAADFLNTVRKINLELGTTILITEHRLEDIYHAADRVVVMDQGQILTDGTPRQVCDFLQRREHEMFTAMPAPCRCSYGIRWSNGRKT